MHGTVQTESPITIGHLTKRHDTKGFVVSSHPVIELATEKDDLPTRNKPKVLKGDLVTKELSKFVVDTSQSAVLPDVSTKLKALFLDYVGVSAAAGFAAESTSKFLTGISSFARGCKGGSTVLTQGSSFLPQYAALLNGALCHTYDFDDTHAPAILHPGASVISAALAEAESQKATGSELLLALLVGYEVGCRIGIALGNGSYGHGFHNTGTAGIFGSIAAVCKLRNVSQQVIEDAFGLGVSKAAGSMQFLENGSWNKRLHPGFAAHDALLCVALAEAGVVGATQPIEGKYGVLHNFSSSPNPANITKDLGTTWHFLATACKPFPACRMTHGQLEAAGNLRTRHANKGIPQKITIHLPKANYPIVGLPTSNKIHPETIVDAQFSSYFQTAATFVHGNNLGWAIYEKITDGQVLDLCKRITCEIDYKYTNLESKMEVVFEDGEAVEEEVVFPLGETQRPFEWETGVKRKFLGLAEPVYGREKSEMIAGLVETIENVGVQDLMRLLA